MCRQDVMKMPTSRCQTYGALNIMIKYLICAYYMCVCRHKAHCRSLIQNFEVSTNTFFSLSTGFVTHYSFDTLLQLLLTRFYLYGDALSLECIRLATKSLCCVHKYRRLSSTTIRRSWMRNVGEHIEQYVFHTKLMLMDLKVIEKCAKKARTWNKA